MSDLKALKALKNKILSYAMQGKLVKQDKNDEPASILYEKIQKEKAALLKQGKIKKEKPLKPITDNEVPYEIPSSWKWVRLGEVINLLSGQDLNLYDINYDNVGIPYITGASSIQDNKIIIDRWTVKPAVISNKNDVLITCKGTVGKIIINNISDVHIARQIMSLKAININNIYLYFFLLSCRYILISNTRSLIPGISRNDIQQLLFPLPPLAEQERIVKKLEEIFTIIDEIEKNITENKKISKILYSRLLSYAMQGTLVKQDKNDEPASILYEKIQKEKAALLKQGKIKKEKPLPPINKNEVPYEIPSSWKWVRLGEVCEIYTGNSINTEIKNTKYTNLKQGYNYIATKDVYFNTTIDYENGIKIPFNEINFKTAQKNTTLICIEGGSAGRKIGFLNQDVCFGNKLCNINGYLLYNKYLFYFAQSPIFLYLFNEYKVGIIGGVSINLIKNMLFPLQPLAEQERIVAKIEEIKEIIDELT